MAYTAFEKMRLINLNRFHRDAGPFQPPLYEGALEGTDLKGAALRFLRKDCEGLRFEDRAEENGHYEGKSYSDHQIPYNMQMDIDRLCLEKSLESFIASGVAEDAYNVYYCFLEMFFGRYGKSKKMVELLSEYESNGSSLLMKHRDHYSHSVYVFSLGLAIYECNEVFRAAFRQFYHLAEDTPETDRKAAHLFLEIWGMASLFHDIGYPFELPFEQVMSYEEVRGHKRGPGSLYIAYRDLPALTGLDDKARAHFKALYGKTYDSITDLFAHELEEKLGDAYDITEAGMKDVMDRKAARPCDFNYFMDHAFFSAVRLFHEASDAIGIGEITREHVDALTAILLHNSLFKFSIAFYKDRLAPLPLRVHPVAWLLMLCDELQCWDRTSYGRNSRKELHPMAADFDFSLGQIRVMYYFDRDEQDKIDDFLARYRKWQADGREGKAPRLKDYSDMAVGDGFAGDIRRIVDLRDIPLTVQVSTREADYTIKHTYLSDSNFMHLCDFAVALNGRYAHVGEEDTVTPEQLENEFESLSLEYKLSNINQVKSFSRYLDELSCFYTDRPVDYAMLRAFSREQTDVIGPMEHARWVREHIRMGWHAGDDYETLPLPEGGNENAARKALREQTRQHKLVLEGDADDETLRRHYLGLSEDAKSKDYEPFNSMLKLVKKFDGLRIYRLKA